MLVFSNICSIVTFLFLPNQLVGNFKTISYWSIFWKSRMSDKVMLMSTNPSKTSLKPCYCPQTTAISPWPPTLTVSPAITRADSCHCVLTLGEFRCTVKLTPHTGPNILQQKVQPYLLARSWGGVWPSSFFSTVVFNTVSLLVKPVFPVPKWTVNWRLNSLKCDSHIRAY